MAVRLARGKGRDVKSPLRAGAMLTGKYRIECVLGIGGMGTVYAAHHELLDQRVALKVLFEDEVRDEEASARFLREARSVARLQSEHVCRVMDIDTLENGVPFIVMEYLEGSDLGRILQRHHLFSPQAAVDYVLQALEAIAQAHAQGIIHRDLKPSNLFLATVPDGSQIIKVLDFGISKPTFEQAMTLTSSRAVLGSPAYMSPEQVRAPRTVDARTDIWSMGIVLYELLTTNMPFDGEQVGELFAAILERDPASIRRTRADVPEGLERVIFKCLAKRREDRYIDVAELAMALAPYATGGQVRSIDRITSTLMRGSRLSAAPRPPGSAPRLPGEGSPDDTTPERHPPHGIDAENAITDPAPPNAPELSPTASTLAKRRTVLIRRSSTGFTIVGAAVVIATGVNAYLFEPTAPTVAPATPPMEASSLPAAASTASSAPNADRPDPASPVIELAPQGVPPAGLATAPATGRAAAPPHVAKPKPPLARPPAPARPVPDPPKPASSVDEAHMVNKMFGSGSR